MNGEALALVGLRQTKVASRLEIRMHGDDEGSVGHGEGERRRWSSGQCGINNANRWSILFVVLRLASVCVSLVFGVSSPSMVCLFACAFCCCLV